MYKSDKRTTEEALLLFQLQLLANESMSAKNDDYAAPVREAMKKVCEGKNLYRIVNRCRRISLSVMIPLVCDKQSDKIDGHKFILVLHALAELIINDGYNLPVEVIEQFEPFLEVESNQDVKGDKKISDDDWLRIKQSAEKIANKIYIKLKEEGYYA